MPMPCIIHWNFNHFVVLEGFKGDYVYLNDPAVGRRRLTYQELDEGFTGVVLTFKKTPAWKPEKKKSTLKLFILSRLKGQYEALLKLLCIGLLLIFPGLVLPVLSQVFLDDVLSAGYRDWTTKILVFMGALVLLRAGLSYYRSIVLQKLRTKMSMLSSLKFLRHIFRLPIVFFDQRDAGDLVSRMENNEDVDSFLAGDLASTALSIFTAVFYLIIMILYSWELTAVGLCGTAVSLVIMLCSRKYLEGMSMKARIASGKLYGSVCSGVSITDTVKASGAERAYIGRILGYQAKNVDSEQEIVKFQKAVGTIPAAAGSLTDVLLMLCGGVLVIQGKLTMGMLVAFNAMYDSFNDPVGELVGFVQKIQTMRSNISRVEDISKYRQDPRYATEKEQPVFSKLRGDVEIRDVSFGYSRLKPPLIEHFAFHVPVGESVAFVGSSGCGKSTVAKVVSGLYSPWSGEVLIDGIPLSSIPKTAANASIAKVDQNIMLFSGTVRENLKMWNDAITDEDMLEAARDACIHDFVMQKGGYDYKLDEGAANLSGGERQRMEIARALTVKPSVLILDEATSALDPPLEKKIMDNIKRRGCTCIIVAHRLSAIRDCNRIIVMQKGKIVQFGAHETLMALEGPYRDLIQNA